NHSAMTKSQMANLLGFSLRTFQRRLDQAKLKIPRGLIHLDNQKIILLKLGFSEILKSKRNNVSN
ncbi:MAG: hypothetical protein SH818_04075, partial [Saprospiraceae bacterium]|nr:hypothetical protein [Saprospiraceae bacterium]